MQLSHGWMKIGFASVHVAASAVLPPEPPPLLPPLLPPESALVPPLLPPEPPPVPASEPVSVLEEHAAKAQVASAPTNKMAKDRIFTFLP
jgi:hypothetical protein